MSVERLDLSVVIPVCDVEQYIGPCLESVYRQGLKDEAFEVIIVNDGSTDGSMDAVERIRALHGNIVVLSQEHAGPSVARNTAIDRAKGEYVLFVDSDDLLMDGGLCVLLQKAKETAADMVVADYMRKNDDEIAAAYDSRMTDARIVDKTGIDYYMEDYDPRVGSFIWRILYRRTLLDDNGIRLEPGVYYEDIPFLQECLLRARRVIGLHLLYYIYRIRQRSCTYTFAMKNAMDYNTAIANTWRLREMPDLPEKVRRRLKENVGVLFDYAVDCIISVFRDRSEREEIVRDLVRKVPAFSNAYVEWRLFCTKVAKWSHVRLGI